MTVSVAEVAAALDRSEYVVVKALERGELPGFQVGRRWYLPDDWETRAMEAYDARRGEPARRSRPEKAPPRRDGSCRIHIWCRLGRKHEGPCR